MNAFSLIEKELEAYLQGEVQIPHPYSQAKLVNRILIFENQIYPTGKTDSQGNYKYYFDIRTPRVQAEIKNIDFDTKDIVLYSDAEDDYLPVFLANAGLKEWLRDNGQADALNESIEEAASRGNVVWKKVKGGYERVDLRNFYVINQTARTLVDTPAIERHEMTQSELRKRTGVWKNVDEVIKECGNKFYTATATSPEIEASSPIYEIYERNGEISLADLKEAQGKTPADKDDEKFVLAKLVVAGISKAGTGAGSKHVLYADEISKTPYKEHHRGPYQGRWWRVGLTEALFDVQVRANEIGNQIARGLEWSSKTFFRSKDQQFTQNILTDLMSGDIIKSEDIQQIPVRMEGMDQLLADWNRLMDIANQIANSYEVVTGESQPAGQPFRTTGLLNQNANKLYDFLREKLAISVKSLFEDWILPDLMKDLKSQDILRLTGSSNYFKRFNEIAVNAWYINNLVALPPHGPDVAAALKAEKLAEVEKAPEALVSLTRDLWEGVRARVQVTITAEQTRLQSDVDNIMGFAKIESDPVRRTALIELGMGKTGIDVGNLPKSPPQMPASGSTQPNAPLTAGAEKTL
jgi:hypothetical protein